MPSPNSAGVFGMQRTMGWPEGDHAARLPKSMPAQMETNNLFVSSAVSAPITAAAT